eukprot:g13525.t1
MPSIISHVLQSLPEGFSFFHGGWSTCSHGHDSDSVPSTAGVGVSAHHQNGRRPAFTAFFSPVKTKLDDPVGDYKRLSNRLKNRRALTYKMKLNMNLLICRGNLKYVPGSTLTFKPGPRHPWEICPTFRNGFQMGKSYADGDPICQSQSNCPDRGLFFPEQPFGNFGMESNAGEDMTGPDEDLDDDGDDGGKGPIAEDEIVDVGGALKVCDGWGRIETAGKFPWMGEFCSDPHRRGYNICVSVLPADFSKRTGGLCYSSDLNIAAQSDWFFVKNYEPSSC